MRDATNAGLGLAGECGISIHASHAGRDSIFAGSTVLIEVISIHASHAGRDIFS